MVFKPTCVRNLRTYEVEILHFTQKTVCIIVFFIHHEYSTLHRYCDEIL